MKRWILALTLTGSLVGGIAGCLVSNRPGASPAIEGVELTDIDACTLLYYTNRIEPVLQSRCASCHGTGSGGSLRMNAGAASAALINQNYAVFRPYVSQEDQGNPLSQQLARRVQGEQHATILSQSDADFLELVNWIDLERSRLGCENGEVITNDGESEF
jgi:hypothetical protein